MKTPLHKYTCKKFKNPNVREQTIEVIDGEHYIMENGEKVLHLRNGSVFNGSTISENGRWATCNTCGCRHAIGLRCASCDKRPAARSEHKDARKREVKGI